jgi:hypothetical protein
VHISLCGFLYQGGWKNQVEKGHDDQCWDRHYLLPGF